MVLEKGILFVLLTFRFGHDSSSQCVILSNAVVSLVAAKVVVVVFFKCVHNCVISIHLYFYIMTLFWKVIDIQGR